MVAPAIKDTNDEFRIREEWIGTLNVTIFLSGYCIGPLFLGPLSELYGRYLISVLSNWFFVAWLLGCALAKSMTAQIVMRLLAGIGGSGAMTLAPAVCADMYVVERRGRSTATVILMQCVGPIIGPLIGSFVTSGLGWRWNYWLLLIMTGSITAVMTVWMKESYPPVILKRKARRLRRETGRKDLEPLLRKDVSRKRLVATSLIRSVKLLTCSPIMILVCLYLATAYGIMYLWFTSFPAIFEHTYHWPARLTGLSYVGMGVGQVLALLMLMYRNDAMIARLTKQNGNVYEPEFRLHEAVFPAALVPVSLIWFGWAAQLHAHWIVPNLASTLFGFGLVGFYVPMQQYVVDAFGLYAASAVAAVRTSVSFVGVVLPLAGTPMFDLLGLGWGNTLLGGITLVMTPIPWLFGLYGKYLRERWSVTL